ncbi:fas-associated death domain protein [Plakobranchus ocellatus]|uniref:Fas-associated death domain protein n=1 Tax=Plakobranchus ocellatus TaxID=259542 RepID=A0AAV4D3T9_9GAST|nr:fas-associated death domain protein [Plakobranchus ocellatus]
MDDVDQEKLAFRSMLLDVARNIEETELERLKLLCSDFIGVRTRSQIKTTLALFEELEKQGKLKVSDVSFLVYLLEKGCKDRPNLLSIVETYKTQHPSHKSEAQKAIAQFMSTNLGKDFKRVLRCVGLDDPSLERLQLDYPGKTEEVIYQGFIKCFSDPINASVEKVLESLERSHRKDLADIIRSGSYV